MSRLGNALIIAACIAPTTAQADPTNPQLCKAGISNLNRIPLADITAFPFKEYAAAHYTRASDGKPFTYLCDITGSEIRWRDKTLGKWATTTKLNYKTTANSVTITQIFMGDPMKPVVYNLSDL